MHTFKSWTRAAKPISLGKCVWTQTGSGEHTSQSPACPVNTTFPSSHTHVKNWDGFEHPVFRETFQFSYPGSKQITSRGTSRWFLLAFYTLKTLSAFSRIQVLPKQALASLHIISMILCAANMENKKPQALGNDLNFNLK